jgi:hypothetical protein
VIFDDAMVRANNDEVGPTPPPVGVFLAGGEVAAGDAIISKSLLPLPPPLVDALEKNGTGAV